VEEVAARLPALCGPDPVPTLLDGDAQQNNFVRTADGAMAIDIAPYFGHPEADFALTPPSSAYSTCPNTAAI